MNDKDNSEKSSLRLRTFLIGTVATGLFCGLIVLCVPGKPDIVAEAAKSQALAESQSSSAPQSNAAVAASTTPPGPAALRAAPTGQKLYERFCAGCHGADGKAQTTMAKMMASKPTNLADGPWKGEQTKAAIADIVKNGKGAMPGYGKEISNEAELSALAEHVLSLRNSTKP